MGTNGTTFQVGDRCMYLVQDRPGAAPLWVTGTIRRHAFRPYAGFEITRDGFACNYFIAEEEVRSL